MKKITMRIIAVVLGFCIVGFAGCKQAQETGEESSAAAVEEASEQAEESTEKAEEAADEAEESAEEMEN